MFVSTQRFSWHQWGDATNQFEPYPAEQQTHNVLVRGQRPPDGASACRRRRRQEGSAPSIPGIAIGRPSFDRGSHSTEKPVASSRAIGVFALNCVRQLGKIKTSTR